MASITRTSLSDPLRQHEALCYRCLFRGLNHMCLALGRPEKAPIEATMLPVAPTFTNPFAENTPILPLPQNRESSTSTNSRRSRRSGGIFNRVHSGIQKLTSQPCMLTRADTVESTTEDGIWYDGDRKISIWSEHSTFSEDSCATVDSMTTVDDDDMMVKSQYHLSDPSVAEEFSYEEAYDAVRDLIASPQKSNFFHEISTWSANTSEAGADDSSIYSVDSMTASDEDEDWSPSTLHLSGDSFVYNRTIQEVELRGFKNKIQSFGEPKETMGNGFTRRAFRDTFGGNRI